MITKFMATSIILLGLSFPTLALAEPCTSGRSTQSPAVKMLQRQLSALRSIQRGRGCKPGDTGGGFFNACRDVDMKINEVQQELRATAAANNECIAATRTERKDKTPTRSPTTMVSASGSALSQAAREVSKKMRGPRNALQYCVRLSDGYYFPTPNSQYDQKGGTDAALVQCKMICKTDGMAVYVNDQNDEAAEMVSARSGESYADLLTAYDYHGDGKFERCDWNGYVEKVSSLLMTKGHSRSFVQAAIPKPTSKPDEGPEVEPKVQSQQFHSAPTKVVRIVGPSFIPDADNEAFDLMRRNEN